MKKQLLTLATGILLSGAAFAQFTAAQIWNLNQRVDPMPHNTINMLYFDMAVSYNTRGVPVTGLSSAQPGLPLPTFKISSTVDGNKVICISQEKEGNEPWEDKERATFESDGTYDTAITIEQNNGGTSFEKSGKILIERSTNANQYTLVTYGWNGNAWNLNNKAFYYVSNNKIDSTVNYRFTSGVDSTRNSFTTYYYSTGLDSSLHSILQTSTNQFEVQNKVLVLQKEAGKTKQFAVEARNTTGGPFQRTATFTYKNTASSVAEIVYKNNFTIYPNPVSETIFIHTTEKGEIKTISVIDLSGKILKTASNTKQINVQELVQGAYLLQVETEAGISFQKFIKH